MECGRPFFYDSLIHHGRPGFIFQKLRDPRSYDYKKIETKGYTERLVMPKFPVTEEEAEAIATFVLGLVAEPPSSDYVYTPDRQAEDRNQGEILLQKIQLRRLPHAGHAGDRVRPEFNWATCSEHPTASGPSVSRFQIAGLETTSYFALWSSPPD